MSVIDCLKDWGTWMESGPLNQSPGGDSGTCDLLSERFQEKESELGQVRAGKGLKQGYMIPAGF